MARHLKRAIDRSLWGPLFRTDRDRQVRGGDRSAWFQSGGCLTFIRREDGRTCGRRKAISVTRLCRSGGECRKALCGS